MLFLATLPWQENRWSSVVGELGEAQRPSSSPDEQRTESSGRFEARGRAGGQLSVSAQFHVILQMFTFMSYC